MRYLLCLLVIVAAVVADARPAPGGIMTYQNRNQWNAAVGGGPSWLVNFNSFRQDTPFREAPVDCGPFSLVQVGEGDFRNLIDVSPFQYNDGPSNKHASMFTDYGRTSVQMTFHAPVYAWGAQLYSVDSEWVNLDLVLDLGGVLATISPNRSTGFFGVVSTDPHTAIQSIVFRSRDNQAQGGEGFGMDNVVGSTTVPEPSSLTAWASLGAIAIVVAYRNRRRMAG